MTEDDSAECCPICDKKECQKHLLEVLYRARSAWVQSVRATGNPKAPPTDS
jgi:hypothetical protein